MYDMTVFNAGFLKVLLRARSCVIENPSTASLGLGFTGQCLVNDHFVTSVEKLRRLSHFLAKMRFLRQVVPLGQRYRL